MGRPDPSWFEGLRPTPGPDATGMTIAAVHLGQIPNVHRMFEGNSFFVTNQRCAALELRLHRVARIAVFADHLAIGADVLSIVAPEAAQSVEVTDIVGVRAPVSFM